MKSLQKFKHFEVEVEGETQIELFEAAYHAAEVFGEEKCGLCDSVDIKPVVRTVTQGKKEFKYCEFHCKKCGGRLTLSQNMDGGTLYPVRALMESGAPATGDNRGKGKFGKHNGWTKYRGEKAAE